MAHFEPKIIFKHLGKNTAPYPDPFPIGRGHPPPTVPLMLNPSQNPKYAAGLVYKHFKFWIYIFTNKYETRPSSESDAIGTTLIFYVSALQRQVSEQRSCAAAEGLSDALVKKKSCKLLHKYMENIPFEKACNRRMTFKEIQGHSLQMLLI